MQGVFVSDAEINRITRFWKGSTRTGSDNAKTATVPSSNMFDSNKPAEPVQSRAERLAQPAAPSSNTLSQKVFGNVVTEPEKPANPDDGGHDDDELYEEAVELVKRMNKASISLLQRRLRIGYTRAARLIDLMVQRGVINAAEAGDGSPQASPDQDE
jgi:DNA segregation ATPase FtsK/SpoIIIE-like protein